MSAVIKTAISQFDAQDKSFNPGIKPTEIDKMFSSLDSLNSFKAAKSLVAELYTCKNGQKSNAVFGAGSYRFLKLKEAISAYKFLNNSKEEISKPYMPTWFPLLENAGGDRIVLDFKTLKLIEWFHDSSKRPTAGKNLAEFIKKGISESKQSIASVKKGNKLIPNPPGNAGMKKLTWMTLDKKSVNEKELKNRPVGSVIVLPKAGPYFHFYYLIKIEKDWWVEACGYDEVRARKEWLEYSKRAPRRVKDEDYGPYYTSQNIYRYFYKALANKPKMTTL